MKKRLTIDSWANILRNLEYDSLEVEVLWLDGTDEYCLCEDCELFEDGFETEKQAYDRLEEIQKLVRGQEMTKDKKQIASLIVSLLENTVINSYGITDFEVWCEDNLNNKNQELLSVAIAPFVDTISKLLEVEQK